MPTLSRRIDMIYLNNENSANSRTKKSFLIRTRLIELLFGYKLTRRTFVLTKNKSNCSSKGSKSVKVPNIYGNFTYVCTLIHDRVSLRMDAIAVDAWNFAWLWTLGKLSLITNVFCFLIKIRANLSYQKHYLHFSIGSKSKQIFKPLSLFYNLTFHSTSSTLQSRLQFSWYNRTCPGINWFQTNNSNVATKVQSQLKDHTSTVISAVFAQLHVALLISSPSVVSVFLSCRNLYWC